MAVLSPEIKHKGYPTSPITIGDFLKKKRLDEGILISDVCRDLNIFSSTLHRWENNLTKPLPPSRNKIINYLGFEPLSKNIKKKKS